MVFFVVIEVLYLILVIVVDIVVVIWEFEYFLDVVSFVGNVD